jgi:hypothetical protein
MKKKNKAHPHFTFGDPKPDTSMLTSCDDAEGDEVSFLMRDGQPGILLDTGASNQMFLLTDRTPMERYVDSDRVIGTAHSQGKLRVQGTGLDRTTRGRSLPRPQEAHHLVRTDPRVGLQSNVTDRGGTRATQGEQLPPARHLCQVHASIFVGRNSTSGQSATGGDGGHGDN